MCPYNFQKCQRNLKSIDGLEIDLTGEKQIFISPRQDFTSAVKTVASKLVLCNITKALKRTLKSEQQ